MPVVIFLPQTQKKIEARVVVPRRAKVISEYPARIDDKWILVSTRGELIDNMS